MHRRRVKFKLTPRQLKDNPSLLKEIERAFKKENITVDFKDPDPKKLLKEIYTKRNVELEDIAKKSTGKALDEVDKNSKKEGAIVDDPETALKKIKSFKAEYWDKIITAAKVVRDIVKSILE